MHDVHVITDTIAQLPPDVARQYRVEIVPAATAVCGGKVLTDGIDLTSLAVSQFLDRSSGRTATAAISPAYFTEVFQRLSDVTGEMLCITVSQKLSSVFGSASIAAGQVTASRPWLDLKVFDSGNAAGGQGLIVLAAAAAAARGCSLGEVLAAAGVARRRVWCTFVLDTLRYVYRTGRVPKILGDTAEAVQVKPMLKIGEDGRVHLVGLVRSRRKAINRILDNLEAEAGGGLIDLFVMHSAAASEAAEMETDLRNRFKCRHVFVSEFSPVMALGAGPGVLGVAALPAMKRGVGMG